jgi:hypothetical protein
MPTRIAGLVGHSFSLQCHTKSVGRIAAGPARYRKSSCAGDSTVGYPF